MTSIDPHLALSHPAMVCPSRLDSLGTGRRRQHGRVTAERSSAGPHGAPWTLAPKWLRRRVGARILVLRLRLNAGGGFHRHPSHKPGDGREIHRHKQTLRSAGRIVVCHLLLLCLLPWNRATTRVVPKCPSSTVEEGIYGLLPPPVELARAGCSPAPLLVFPRYRTASRYVNRRVSVDGGNLSEL